MTETRQWILSLSKYTLLITLTHLYMFVCTLAYHKLEGFDETKQSINQVETFLLTTNLNIKTNPSQYLMKYKENDEQEKYWKIRHAFNSIPRSYVFVLATHTTLGNRHMMLQTWKGHLFYIFTVPIGVILYYVMIHAMSKLYTSNMQLAVMYIFRREDRDMSDKEREYFENLKVIIVTFLITILFILTLGMTSLIDGNHYIEEIYYVIDIFFKISSSKHFLSLDDDQSEVNAFLSTLIYFTCILFAYSNVYLLLNLFKSHDIKDMIVMCGGEHIYKAINLEEEKGNVDDDDESVWDNYESQSIKSYGGSTKK